MTLRFDGQPRYLHRPRPNLDRFGEDVLPVEWNPVQHHKPIDGTVLHLGSVRYFTPPPQVIATPVNLSLFMNPASTQTPAVTQESPVLPERSLTASSTSSIPNMRSETDPVSVCLLLNSAHAARITWASRRSFSFIKPDTRRVNEIQL
jgi:hypothetical protein